MSFFDSFSSTLARCRRTSENAVWAKFTGELTYPIAPALMLQVAGWGIGQALRSANIGLQQEGIHHRAYLSIGVTSYSGVGLCGMSGGVISWGTGVWLCRILDMNFRENLFHDVGRIDFKVRTTKKTNEGRDFFAHPHPLWGVRY